MSGVFPHLESARATGVCVGLVRKMVRAGELEAIKIGRWVRIPRHALLKLCGAKE